MNRIARWQTWLAGLGLGTLVLMGSCTDEKLLDPTMLQTDGAVVQAVPAGGWDLFPDEVEINGGLWISGQSFKVGTGVIDPFLGIQNKDQQQGFNTDGKFNYDQTRSNFTDALPLNVVSQIEHEYPAGTTRWYREFILDANEADAAPAAQFSIDQFELWLCATPAAATYENYEQFAGPPANPACARIYDFKDPMLTGAEKVGYATDGKTNGSGNSLDYYILIPEAYFTAFLSGQGKTCYYNPADNCGVYVILWNKMGYQGAEWVVGSTFEEYSTLVRPVPVTVTACKLEDVDTNPATTADRVPVQDWDVYLSIGGVRQTPGAKTGADGCYTWINLPAGPSYDVEEDVPADWYALGPTKYDFGPSTAGSNYSYTFVNAKRVSVKACKLEDVDTNPATTADRVAVPGWTVKLSKNGDVIDTQLTGADGCYTWSNLDPLAPPNYYDAHEEVPADWYAWTPTSVNCTAGVNGGACNATFVNSKKVNVKACKLEDVDGNPATTADRVPVSGWTVKLTKNGDVQDTKTTGADGCYTWSNLDPLAPPNYYDAHEVVTEDWMALTPTSVDCNPIPSGGTCTATFVNAERKVEVKACKLEDVDTNPATTADRVAVPGWTVKLTKNGVVQDTKTTGSDGCYTWTDLPYLTGTDYYDVHEEVPADWYAWTPTSVNCTAGVNGGACNATFVNSKKVNVKACKLEDVDGNPATTADRVPVSGWTVKLTKNGDVQDTKTTGADGCYTWSNLDPLAPPNYYDAHEEVPADWYAWTPTSVNCDPIASGGTCTATFINTEYATKSGYKWNDLNGDGAWDTGEPAISGWSISLTGTKNSGGAVNMTVVTDANGKYELSGLLPGDYAVCEELQAGWTQTFPDLGYGCSNGTVGYSITLASGDVEENNNFGNWMPPMNDETAWAANGDTPGFLRYIESGNWATYVAYAADKTVTLFAGRTKPAGAVHFSAPDNGYVTITITLSGGWTFFHAEGKDNVMVQDYATAPLGINPSPGLFAWKDFASSSPFQIVVPLNNYYGVHAVVVGPPM